jgi:uncharacterized protein YqeY
VTRPPEVPDPVSLQERVQSDIAVAMRGGDALRRDVLRMVTSAAYSVEKRQGRPLTDDEYLVVLSREVKTRRESVEAFRAGGRQDLVDKEEAEIAIIETFLPQQMDEAAMQAAVAEAIGETGAASIKDMGKVMAALRAKHAATLDMAKAGPMVKARLSA